MPQWKPSDTGKTQEQIFKNCYEPAISSGSQGVARGRSKIIRSIYISKRVCMPRSLSKRYTFITLIFHLQWGEKLQNDHKSSWIWKRTLKSENATELFQLNRTLLKPQFCKTLKHVLNGNHQLISGGLPACLELVCMIKHLA